MAGPTPPATLDTIVLQHGAHNNPDQGMCFVEAAAWLAGEPFTDHPGCVSPVIATFGRSWNDALPTDADRTRLLKRYVPLIVDTNTGAADETARAWLCVDWLTRTYTPAWLRCAGLTAHAERLAALPELAAGVDISPTRAAVNAARVAAGVAARVAAGVAARDAAGDAARDAARGAARVAAGVAARVAAWAAARGAARGAARVAAGAAAWVAAGVAAGDAAGVAAGVAAWDAAGDAAGVAAWDAAWVAARDAAGDAARDAARDAAGDSLQPTVAELQLSACDLLDRMIAVGRQAA